MFVSNANLNMTYILIIVIKSRACVNIELDNTAFNLDDCIEKQVCSCGIPARHLCRAVYITVVINQSG